jgi:hypothetical protein
MGILFVTMSRPALGLTRPPIQWVQEAVPWVVKRPGRERPTSVSFIVLQQNVTSLVSCSLRPGVLCVLTDDTEHMPSSEA